MDYVYSITVKSSDRIKFFITEKYFSLTLRQ
jgi:hypothetical protein